MNLLLQATPSYSNDICIYYMKEFYTWIISVGKHSYASLCSAPKWIVTCSIVAHSPCRTTRNSKVELQPGICWVRLIYFKYSAHTLLVLYNPASVIDPSITLTTYIMSSWDLFSNITAWSGMWPDTAGTHCSTVPGVLWYIRIWKMFLFFLMIASIWFWLSRVH